MEAQNSDVCRLCLASIKPFNEILLNNNRYLIKSIFIITGLEVVSDSEQCEYLCSQCRTLLEQCVEFRNTCINNDGIFREMMTRSKYIEETELGKPAIAEFIKHEPVEIFEETISQHNSADLEELADDANRPLENDTLLSHEIVEPSLEPLVNRKRKSKKKNDGGPNPRKNYRNVSKVPCPQCGAMVALYNLKHHQEIHDPNRRKVRCPHCPKEYAHKKHLKLHINANHTREFLYPCDRCERTYLSRNALNEHYRGEHSDEKRYACKVCGERFGKASSRSYHQQTVHSTARPFVCEYCDKAFKFKSDFVVHTRIHTGEKPFECDICGKAFSKSYNVVLHKKSHRNSVELPMLHPGS